MRNRDSGKGKVKGEIVLKKEIGSERRERNIERKRDREILRQKQIVSIQITCVT